MIEYSKFREFKTNEEIIDWIKIHYPEIVMPDKNSEWYYPLLGYTGGMYREINNNLRYCQGNYELLNNRNKKDLYDDIVPIINFLEKRCLPENVVLYRYTNMKDIKNANNKKKPKIGDTLTYSCFCSTSLWKGGIEHLTEEHRHSCLLKIYAEQGTIGSYVSLAENADGYCEHEFLLPLGARFKILSLDNIFFPKAIECVLLKNELNKNSIRQN